MARVPMVTRTIVTTKATVMVVNITQGETETRTVTLPRTYKDDKTLLKQCAKVIDNEETKVVTVLASEEVETLYGMTEQQFIETAQVLPPRTEKTEESVA